jgi:hypothetical protein
MRIDASLINSARSYGLQQQIFKARRGEPTSSGKRDKIVLAHALEDQKYG